MATTSMIHIRIEDKLKLQATETLASMGLSVSDAVRVFLTRVVAEQQLPFVVKVHNAETRMAMSEADAIASRHQSRFANGADLIDELQQNVKKQS